MSRFCCAATVAALSLCGTGQALAQDITLLSREGKLALSGSLLGFDGEFIRIKTEYGPLTVDAQGVICQGPACPTLTAPKATIRIVGAPHAGARLLPGLFAAFARSRGLIYEEGPAEGGRWQARLLEAEGREVLAELSFAPTAPEAAREAVEEGAAELMLTYRSDPAARTLASEALVAVMAEDNPTAEVSTTALAAALTGQSRNWRDLGGPDMPIVVHMLSPETDQGAAILARLGARIKADVWHPDPASLLEAVRKDPWALAITGQAAMEGVKPLLLTDSCGFRMQPSRIAVKVEDYPLSLPLFFVPGPRRLPLMAREFLEFLGHPAADQAVAEAGYTDRGLERIPMTQDGLRLLNAITAAGEEVTLEDLKRLSALMHGAERLSMTFRFEDRSAVLDAHSRENLAQLARMIGAGQFQGERLILVGFSDGTGRARANLAVARDQALRVGQDLAALLPDLPEEQLPEVETFGEMMPMACDATPTGRRLNRRVELWVVPEFTRPRG